MTGFLCYPELTPLPGQGPKQGEMHDMSGLQPAKPATRSAWYPRLRQERWQDQAGRPFIPCVTWSTKGFLFIYF